MNTMAWSHRKIAGHSNPQKDVVWKPVCNKMQRRPKMRWLDDVSTDLRKMGINEWRDRARDREAWRHCNGGQGPHRAVAS
jgi:hypothetical protein